MNPVVYIYGEEDYLIEDALRSIKDEVLGGGFESLNYHVYDSVSIDVEQVLTTAMTMPAMSPRRVIVVRNATSLKPAQEREFLKYIENPSPSTVLVFLAHTRKAISGSSLFNSLREKGWVRGCRGLSHDRLFAWIRGEARRQGKGITVPALRMLAEMTGGRLRDVKGELDKIITFVGDKKEIDVKDVEICGLQCGEESIFGLADAIGSRDVTKAFRILGRIDEPPPKVLWAISRQLRLLLKLKTLLRKKTPSREMTRLLGIQPRHLDGYLKRVRLFSEEELLRAVEKLYRADREIKTGTHPQGLVLSRLIMDLSYRGGTFHTRDPL